MKILKKDLKHNTMKIEPETEDDLWILEKVISKGDIVSGSTTRSIQIEKGDRKEKIRKKVFLKIETEDVEFNENQLRIKGQIIEGPEEVSHGYHTIDVTINKNITIEKEWTKYLLDRIYDARKKQPPILICVLDDESANFALLTERLQHLAEIRGETGKSLGEVSKKDYFNEIRKYIEDNQTDKIVLAGPGFTKENFLSFLKEKNPSLYSKIFSDTTAHTGKTGIQEVLKRGLVEKINKESNISKETKLVEEFLEKIAKDDKITYGLQEVRKALDLGAIEKLLISDKLVKTNEEILKETEKMGGEVKIISSEHEAGERFLNMNGVAAFLRYEIN